MNQDLAVFITPFGFMVACALIAGGVIYFIEIKFMHTRQQAIGAIAGGAVMLAILEIVLLGSSVGFFKAQQVQTSACELEGESAHPEARQTTGNQVIQKQIVACMKEFGYEWTPGHHSCAEAPLATNAYCYLPVTAFDRTITSIQLSFE